MEAALLVCALLFVVYATTSFTRSAATQNSTLPIISLVTIVYLGFAFASNLVFIGQYTSLCLTDFLSDGQSAARVVSSFWLSGLTFQMVAFFFLVCAITLSLTAGQAKATARHLSICGIITIAVFSGDRWQHSFTDSGSGIGYDHSTASVLLESAMNFVHPLALFWTASIFLVISIRLIWSTLGLKKPDSSKKLITDFTRVGLWALLALFLGGWWAYQEGTWGGWWAWEASELELLPPVLIWLHWAHSIRVYGRLQTSTYMAAVALFMILVAHQGLVNSAHSFNQTSKSLLDANTSVWILITVMLFVIYCLFFPSTSGKVSSAFYSGRLKKPIAQLGVMRKRSFMVLYFCLLYLILAFAYKYALLGVGVMQTTVAFTFYVCIITHLLSSGIENVKSKSKTMLFSVCACYYVWTPIFWILALLVFTRKAAAIRQLHSLLAAGLYLTLFSNFFDITTFITESAVPRIRVPVLSFPAYCLQEVCNTDAIGWDAHLVLKHKLNASDLTFNWCRAQLCSQVTPRNEVTKTPSALVQNLCVSGLLLLGGLFAHSTKTLLFKNAPAAF